MTVICGDELIHALKLVVCPRSAHLQKACNSGFKVLSFSTISEIRIMCRCKANAWWLELGAAAPVVAPAAIDLSSLPLLPPSPDKEGCVIDMEIEWEVYTMCLCFVFFVCFLFLFFIS